MWVILARSGRIDVGRVLRSLATSAGAAAGMGLVCWCVVGVLGRLGDGHLAWKLVVVFVPVILGAAVYGGHAFAAKRRELADLVGRGVPARPKLIGMLTDADSAVRYWAVVALTVLGPEAQPAAEPLMRLLDDPAPNVRLAAAEAMCNLDREAEALPVIAEGLQHEDGWVRLHAAIVTVAVGKDGRELVPQMKQAIADTRKHQAALYIRWALLHALDNLGQRQQD